MIESVAPADEHDSPFYTRNKAICEKLERYLLEKGGRADGEYSSWHIELEGTFESSCSWKIHLDKSTTTAISGTLIRNSTVIERLTVEASNCRHFPEDINIRRSDWWGRIVQRFSSDTRYLDDSRDYLVNGSSSSDNISQLSAILEHQYAQKSVAQIRYSRRERSLVIDFDQLLEDLDTIDKLIHFFENG